MQKPKRTREIILLAALLSFCNCSQALLATPNAADSSNADKLAMQNVHGSWGTVNPPHEKLNTGVFVTGDVLCLRATEDDLDYANLGEDISTGVLKQVVYTPHFRWNWGARAGIGYQFDNFDSWDLYAGWTYVHGKAKDSTSVPFDAFANESLAPTWGGNAGIIQDGGFFVDGGSETFVQSASANWNMVMNVIDLELGRSFYFGRKVTVRPMVGVRTAFIDQDYLVRYETFYNLSSDDPFTGAEITAPGKMKADTDFWGIGLRGGFDLLWHFTQNWGIDGRMSGSILAGSFDVKQDYRSFVVESIAGEFFLESTHVTTKRHPHRTRANLEGALGFFWETAYGNNRHVFIGVYYEVAQWFSQNELTRPFIDLSSKEVDVAIPAVDDTRRDFGDIDLSGLSLKLRFDF